MEISAEVFQEIIGEVVRQKDLEGETISKQELEDEVRKILDFTQQRFDGNFIAARDRREYIGSKDSRGNVIEPGKGGEHQGEIVEIWFNDEKDNREPLVDLDQFNDETVFSGEWKGHEIEITREDVIEAFELTEENSDSIEPGKRPYHSILLGEKWKPVKEVFRSLLDVEGLDLSDEVVSIIEENSFTTNDANRLFRKLGFLIISRDYRVLMEDYDHAYSTGRLEYEEWKFEFLEYFQEQIKADLDLQEMNEEDLYNFFEKLEEAPKVNGTEIIPYLMGGQWGQRAWDTFNNYSHENAQDAAEALSYLFNEKEDLYDRLSRFRDFYEPGIENSNNSIGSLMKTSSALLMFTYPQKYVYYKWQGAHDFFPEFLQNYRIRQGFNIEQYEELVRVSRKMLEDLDYFMSEEANMVHLQNMMHYHNEEHLQESDDVKYWQVAPGKQAKNWEKMKKDSIMAVGYSEFPDISEVESKEDLKELAREVKDWKESRIGHHVSNLWDFLQIEEGDKVVANKGKSAVMGIGEVKNTYYCEEDSDDFPHRIDVEWTKTGEEEIPTNHDFGRTVSEIPDMKYEQIVKSYEGQEVEKYFWITAPQSGFNISGMSKGDTFFYSRWIEEGSKRRKFRRIDKADPGDKVLLYESSPKKAVTAELEVKEGLHKEDHGNMEDVEGVTLEFKRQLEGISWEAVKSLSIMQGSNLVTNGINASVFELSEEQYAEILAINQIEEENLENLKQFVSSPVFEAELPESLFFQKPENLKNEINASLNSGKNIIFTGPPGTGKTKLAKSISKQFSEEESDSGVDEVKGSTFTTATADWTAFDTIGGYMPSQENGEELEFNPGQFLKCFRKDDGEITNKWLVIDEINRSDIDKAFGQLFSVLSGDSVELPYKKDGHVRLEKVDSGDNLEGVAKNEDVYPITDSWRLIATMNTYDKTSLYDMSYAFMRRFNFIHVGVPNLGDDEELNTDLLDPEVEDNYASRWNVGETLNKDDFYQDLTALWYEVNEQRDIGPSIIRDVIKFVEAHQGDRETALAQAVNSLILPQFEGLRKNRQKSFVNALKESKENDEVSIDHALVKEKAENMFNINSWDDE